MTDFPREIKIYAPIGVKTICNDETNPLRQTDRGFMLWCIARALDEKGSGMVDGEYLREACTSYRISKALFQKSLKQAIHAGFMVLAPKTNRLYLASLHSIAEKYNINNVGAYPVMVNVARLVKALSWKSAIWSAYHASRGPNSNPISRDNLVKLTGVPKRSQQAYERKTHVQKRANFKIVGDGSIPEGMGAVARELGETQGTFEVGGQLWYQLPNSYSSRLKRARKGNCRKTNKKLRGGLIEQGLGNPRSKVYFSDREEAEKVQWAYNRYDRNGTPSGMQSNRDILLKQDVKTRSGAGIFLSLK